MGKKEYICNIDFLRLLLICSIIVHHFYWALMVCKINTLICGINVVVTILKENLNLYLRKLNNDKIFRFS